MRILAKSSSQSSTNIRPSNNYALSVLLMGMTTHNLVNESVSVFYVYSKLLLKKLTNNTTFYNLKLFLPLLVEFFIISVSEDKDSAKSFYLYF